MSKFVLVYTGGAMGASPQEQQQAMEAWMNWFGSLGEAVLDVGNPFVGGCTVATDGSATDGGAAGLTGYSIVEAPDLSAAAGLAKGCPVLTHGGGVEVYEALPI
ncbi:MAG: YciI family protein [Acidimicrobiales bacterium]